MFKIFNHYFRRRTILQVIMYSMVIVSTLIVSLALQGGMGVFNGAVISSGVIRGGVMAIGIIGVN